MAQFPFQNAILKIESKKTERALAVRFSFCPRHSWLAPFFIAMQKSASAIDASADLSALRRQITGLVAQNAVAMVQHAIDSVNEEGQYQAIKYLFEMIGLYPASVDETPVEDSLAATLLRHLGLAGTVTPEPQEEITASDPLE